MSEKVQKFKEEREKLNDLIFSYDNLNIKRFFSLDNAVYRDGALDAKTKELLGLVASLVLKCDDCILRKIAILIISGKVGATEIRAEENKDLWNNLTENMNFKKTSRHGEEWHRKMMDVIYEYFKLQNYKIVFEPILNYGRADLGVYSKLNKTLYIEVDTVSLFKLWYNFSTMKNATFLIILSENKVIEFNT